MGSFGRGIQFFDVNAGNSGGTVTDAKNGTHLNGTIVYLGGSLLEDTGIVGNGFNLSIQTSLADDNFRLLIFPSQFILEYFNSITQANFGAHLSGVNGAMSYMQAGFNFGGPQKQVSMDTEVAQGIVVEETVDGVGFAQLITDTPFVPLQFLPGFQYLNEYNAFVAPLDSKFSAITLSSGATPKIYTPVGESVNQLAAYRVTVAMFANIIAGGGACHVQIRWLDQNFISQIFDFPTIVATGDALYVPITIILAPGGTITFNFIVDSDGVNATVMGGVEFINYAH